MFYCQEAESFICNVAYQIKKDTARVRSNRLVGADLRIAGWGIQNAGKPASRRCDIYKPKSY